MAIQIVRTEEWRTGRWQGTQAEVPHIAGLLTLDNSYPTGGYPLDFGDDLTEVHVVLFEQRAGYLFEYDRAAKKVKVLRFDYPAAAAGPAVEVAAGTDLSAVANVGFIAYGRPRTW
ncbi:hypothetical protein [Caldinitratiruptor microaerophilus]|uniref:Uncharacterized protein n=1 Tax=Caldinitratiruptor microaerophilus TaxID=671077 RepID=A0AA35G7B0_9FIRM|nr:hypothetical protein [Caldinitratiruptor microaerophilus]BDG59916.1 hypothetical protein caldi_10060 [Caldinitratiruptor microaerophilus]